MSTPARTSVSQSESSVPPAGGIRAGGGDGSSSVSRVVVVDRNADVADVLAAVLAPQGVSVGHQLPGRGCVDDATARVAVVDAESVPKDCAPAADAYVVVGRWRVPQEALPERLAAAPILDKPFRYPELIAAVERAIRKVA